MNDFAPLNPAYLESLILTAETSILLATALSELRELQFESPHEHLAALYLADIVSASEMYMLGLAVGGGRGYSKGLAVTRTITEVQCDALLKVINRAGECAHKRISATASGK